MARNKIQDLNDHLFSQIERLTEEGVDREIFDLEIERSKALSQLSTQVINSHKLVFHAAKMVSEGSLYKQDVVERYGL